MSVPPTDYDLGKMQPITRVRRVRRMLLPKAVQSAISTLNEGEKHLPKWEARMRSIDRLVEWARGSQTMQELQHRILDSEQVGNLMELDRAFTWFIQRLDEGEIDVSTLDTKPIAIAMQVVAWWTNSMQAADAKVRTAPDSAVPDT